MRSIPCGRKEEEQSRNRQNGHQKESKKTFSSKFISPYQTLDHSATSAKRERERESQQATSRAAFAQTAKKSAPKSRIVQDRRDEEEEKVEEEKGQKAE